MVKFKKLSIAVEKDLHERFDKVPIEEVTNGVELITVNDVMITLAIMHDGKVINGWWRVPNGKEYKFTPEQMSKHYFKIRK